MKKVFIIMVAVMGFVFSAEAQRHDSTRVGDASVSVESDVFSGNASEGTRLRVWMSSNPRNAVTQARVRVYYTVNGESRDTGTRTVAVPGRDGAQTLVTYRAGTNVVITRTVLVDAW